MCTSVVASSAAVMLVTYVDEARSVDSVMVCGPATEVVCSHEVCINVKAMACGLSMAGVSEVAVVGCYDSAVMVCVVNLVEVLESDSCPILAVRDLSVATANLKNLA